MVNKLKNIILWIVIVSQMLTLTVFNTSIVHAYEPQTTLSNAKAEKLLVYLGVKKDNTKDINVELTRGEFADIAVGLLNNTAYSQTGGFLDVPADNPHFASVMALYASGVIQGYDKDTFRPDEKIEYKHALTVLLRMMGYGYLLEQFGEADGHKKVAELIELPLRTSDNSMVSANTVYGLIYDLLFTNVLEYSLAGSEVVTELTDETYLYKRYNIILLSGVLNNNGKTVISGNLNISDNSIVLGDVRMRFTDENIKQYLGYKLDCFVKEEDGEYNIVTYEVSEDNNITEVDGEDITSFSSNQCEYNGDLKLCSLRFDDLTVVYNGHLDKTMTNKEFLEIDGYVNFIDNDGDSRYDVAVVFDEVQHYIDRVSAQSLTAFTETGESICFDESKLAMAVEYVFEGEACDFSKIVAGCVISLAYSRNKEYVRVNISYKELNGKVTRMDDKGVYVDDEYYRYAKQYIAKCESGELLYPAIGEVNTVNLDYRNKVVRIDEDILRPNYAWLEKIFLDDAGGTVYLKMFSDYGIMETLPLNDKLRFNNDRISDNASLLTNPLLTNSEGCIRQLITYERNGKGEITVINTAADMTSVENYIGYDEDNFSLDFVNTTGSYFRGWRQFDFRRYYFAVDVPMFVIPQDKNADEKDYSLETCSSLKGTCYGIRVYDAKRSMIPGCVVWYDDRATGTVDQGSSPFCVVKNVGTGLNADNEEVPVLYGMTNSGEITLTGANSEVMDTEGSCFPANYKDEAGNVVNYFAGVKLSELPEGAVVMYATNAQNEIEDIQIIHIPGVTPYETWTLGFGPSGATPRITPSHTYWAVERFFQFGKIEDIVSGIMVYTIGDTRYPLGMLGADTPIVIVDLNQREKVRLGTFSEIEAGDSFMYQTAWASGGYMFIFKK